MPARLRRSGYSLVELIAVIAILAVVALLIVPRVVGDSVEAEKNACYVNQGDVELQTQLFYRYESQWPANDLSDMIPPGTYDYFPGGVPICPVDGTGYTLDPTTHQVLGHDHG